MLKLFSRFFADESGATAIEYGLIAGLISVAAIATLKRVGGNLVLRFNAVANNLT